VPQIVGFGKAAEMAWSMIGSDMPRISMLIEGLARDLSLIGAVRNGHPVKRLPNILNMTLPGANASLVCGVLGRNGVCISTGAACGTSAGPSNVLMSMGRNYQSCSSSFRVSLSRYSTDRETKMMIARLHGALHEAKKRDI
jgi:cysteine desulfurase